MTIYGSGPIIRSPQINRRSLKSGKSSSTSTFSLDDDTKSLESPSPLHTSQPLTLFSITRKSYFTKDEERVLDWGKEQLDYLEKIQNHLLKNNSFLNTDWGDDSEAPIPGQLPKDHISYAIDARRRVERAKVQMSQK